MAEAGLDALIRQLAKQQQKTLSAAVKKQRDRYAALATRARDAQGKQLNKQLAKDALEIGMATVKRLQMSADNAAHSHARAMRQATETARHAAGAAAKKRRPANRTNSRRRRPRKHRQRDSG